MAKRAYFETNAVTVRITRKCGDIDIVSPDADWAINQFIDGNEAKEFLLEQVKERISEFRKAASVAERSICEAEYLRDNLLRRLEKSSKKGSS